MKQKKIIDSRRAQFASFKSIIPPTAATLSDYMPHASIGKDGSIADEGYVRHEHYVNELDFIFRSYDAWLARFAGEKRDAAARKRDETLRLFDELTLHHWRRKCA